MSLIRDRCNRTGFRQTVTIALSTVLDLLSLGELGEEFSDLASLVLLDVLGRCKLVGVSGSCTN